MDNAVLSNANIRASLLNMGSSLEIKIDNKYVDVFFALLKKMYDEIQPVKTRRKIARSKPDLDNRSETIINKSLTEPGCIQNDYQNE